MRRIHRLAPSPHLLDELNRRQSRAGTDVGRAAREWKNFSNSGAYRALRIHLQQEAGDRARCVYCSDSMGVDIDHYFPKSLYPARAFEYENLLLTCSNCNRRKLDRFPLDAQGRPVLLCPTRDDPWNCLFFAEETGYLSPRLVNRDVENVRGAETVQLLGSVLNSDSVVLGRKRSWDQLVRGLTAIMTDSAHNVMMNDVEQIIDLDDYGLIDWMFHREGQEADDVRGLREEYPDRWRCVCWELSRIEGDSARESQATAG